MESKKVPPKSPPREHRRIAPRSPLARIKAQVLDLLAEIPRGRVTTYGSLAEAVGAGPRQVAFILAREPEACGLPWHRVVAAGGRLSIPDPRHKAEQARLLRHEGVAVAEGRVRNFSARFHAP